TVAYPLTGKIVCGICGKNYRHKINNVGTKYANPVWICSTFNTRGKKHCPSKQIPESVLENIVNSFKKEIKQIITYPDNMLKFIFSDDTETQMQWQNKSRKWTDDMKAENYNNLRKGHKS
ncbi:MAG: zinc ribbon domain-containing protein, partial [Oscillospiraceae bacterium]